MSDAVHMLIPFAYSDSEGCTRALRELALPQLERLVARLTPAGTDAGDESSLSTPHERVLAQAFGLAAADGRIPWAAWQVREAGGDTRAAAWARITPCHWRVETDHIAMGHPQDLQLDPHDSQAMLAAMRPFFEQDGIALEYHAPTLWLARGEVFRDLATASLDRVAGRTVDRWMPRAEAAKTVRRLQQEMQMLLYTHESNEERLRRGQLPVNSFWVSGTGALPASHRNGPPPGLQINHTLRDAALQEDWRGWAAAWRQLDAGECARLAHALDRGEPASLTLCGERKAKTWSGHGAEGMLRRIGRLFSQPGASSFLQDL
ncbi:MAG: phosphoglycerate mutase [Ramlibacter sp.]|nr:phosphoglycerate mutase [Ramlibacter sp.]